MKVWFCAVLVLITMFDGLKASELPQHPLTFTQWKRIQIHEAQSDIVAQSKEIQSLLINISDKNLAESEQSLFANDLKVQEFIQKKNLVKFQFSKELTFEEYFDVYLKQFSNNKKALQYIANRLSKSSVAYLLERSMLGEKKPDQRKESKSSSSKSNNISEVPDDSHIKKAVISK